MKEDLFWIRSTPSLMNIPEPFCSGVDFLRYLNDHTSDLEDLPASQHKLGLYYEDCINHLINKSTKVIDLKRNIVVTKNKKTLGEFDFIGRTSEKDFHLECAIKFYLRVGSGEQLSDFIGPGKRDRLDIKWQRMLEHQLPLSETNEGLRTCHQHEISPSAKALLIQGYLFHPLDEPAQQLHPAINKHHLKGWWIYAKNLQKIQGDFQYQILRKPYWLRFSETGLMNFAALTEQMISLKQPCLIRRLDSSAREIDRGFVLNNDW